MELNQSNKNRLDLHFKERQAPKRESNDGVTDGKAQLNQFWASFNSSKNEAQQVLKSTEDSDDRLKKLEAGIQTAQKLLNESTFFLPPYDIRTAQNVINSLTEELTKQRELNRPKKKFAFKSRQAAPKAPQAVPAHSEREPTSAGDDRKAPKQTAAQAEEEGFKDLQGQVLYRKASERKDEDIADFSLSNLTDCSVYICIPLRAIRMHNLKNCSVFVGPVAGSALLYDCQGCSFALASQQLRVHNTTESDFYLLARSKPIIENCERVRFAPYNFTYPQLDEQLKESLDVPTNLWNSVEDFNWPRLGEPSPHWSILPEEERRTAVSPPSTSPPSSPSVSLPLSPDS